MPVIALKAVSSVYNRTVQLSREINATEDYARDLVTCVFPVIDQVLERLQKGNQPLSFSLSPFSLYASEGQSDSFLELAERFLQWQESVLVNSKGPYWEVPTESVESCLSSIEEVYKGCCFRPRLYFASLVGVGCLAMSLIVQVLTDSIVQETTSSLTAHLQRLGLTDSHFCQLGCLDGDRDEYGMATYWRAIWRSYLISQLPTAFEKWIREVSDPSTTGREEPWVQPHFRFDH